MATAQEHFSWAQENEYLADTFRLDDNLETNWAITILFYAAVHYVDSYLSARNRREPDHDGREKQIALDDFFQPIRKDYKHLKNMSRAARYELAPYTEHDFRKAQSHLFRIRDHIAAPKQH